VDAMVTGELLEQESKWWGKFNIIQIAFLSGCKHFISQEVNKGYFDAWWNGEKVMHAFFVSF
jgi:hypothetical protein